MSCCEFCLRLIETCGIRWGLGDVHRTLETEMVEVAILSYVTAVVVWNLVRLEWSEILAMEPSHFMDILR